MAVDLYSDAKEDWLTDDNLNKYRFPFTTIGGQDRGNGVFAGAYYFLDNASGWRIRPYEDNHGLAVEGNLFGADPNLPLFVPTLGGFSVVVRLNTSSLTQQVSTGSGLSPEQDTKLSEAHTRLGLNADDPFTDTPTQFSSASGDINIAATGDGETSTTQTRQP